MLSSLKKELEKIKQYKPKQYYICCAKELTPDNISEIRSLFSDYMASDRNIITLIEIDNFLQNPDNHAVLKKHYKLWIESTGILQEIWNHDIFIDCESLLSDIEEEKHLFVRTEAFDESMNLLSHNKSLFLPIFLKNRIRIEGKVHGVFIRTRDLIPCANKFGRNSCTLVVIITAANDNSSTQQANH